MEAGDSRDDTFLCACLIGDHHALKLLDHERRVCCNMIADAAARGLPLGSGLIEGGHRHVLQKRLKISGSWWRKKNLHDMAQLRIQRANNKWDQYWKSAA